MNEYGFNTGLLHGTNEKYPQGATHAGSNLSEQRIPT